MTVNLSSKYNHKEVEEGRYQKWLDDGLFKPSKDKKAKPYSVVLPPPNVTGKLHLGHAWDTAIQDMLVRYKRMDGYDTLWVPGMDHAGIATQAKVEARLREQGISRYDLGREKFIQQVWDWKDEYSEIIHKQWAKLGLSMDYDHERFTLDKGLSKAVRKVFVDLYNKGLIYRGEYIINWDPQARTALSDIEVIHKDDKGAFYHVKYPFVNGVTFNGKNYIEIATTRPETMFGDVAVAVNPDDDRYKELVGSKVIVPLVNREIPIIADQYVDPEFGTGMVKITPAHDPNDFLVGNRHNLERINTMNEDATLNENAGKYNGMDRFEARKAIVKDLDELGDLLKVEPIVHSVGHSERTGVQIESRLSTQWFVKMKPLAEQALLHQKTEDKVKFWPERFENTYTQWMNEVHDWVISRQLWWGHRIPAWYHKDTGEIYVGMEAPSDIDNWEQDPDVLDTWFSSALWPFSTLGWPDVENEDYKRYFPTNALVTGYDIIFFWVSRMMFQSIEFTGKKPFNDVLIHGLMRDNQGRKMSKSLGNGIDPMDVIEEYGVDAMRWFLATGSTPGLDVRYDDTKLKSAWNFINKIWNASRYVIMNLDEDITNTSLPKLDELNVTDKWILNKLNNVVLKVRHLFDKYDFGEIGRALYNFVWNDFCDWYIEFSKEYLTKQTAHSKITQKVLAFVLDKTLRLLHPIMPFVTEKLWLSMPHTGRSIMVASYPNYDENLSFKNAEKDVNYLIELITAVRNIRNEANAALSKPIDLFIDIEDPKLNSIFKENEDLINRFCNINKLIINSQINVPKLSMSKAINGASVYIPLGDLIDLDREINRLEKEIGKLKGEVERSNKKLNNDKFISNAPSDVVNSEKEKQKQWQNKLNLTIQRLNELKNNK